MWTEFGVLFLIAVVIGGSVCGGMIRAWSLESRHAELRGYLVKLDARLLDLEGGLLIEKRKRAADLAVEARQSRKDAIERQVDLLKQPQAEPVPPWLFRG